MLTEAQKQYMQEVLGVRPEAYAAAADSQTAKTEVAVLTPPLSEEERELLTKVLASVNLTDHQPIEQEHGDNLPDRVQAAHVLSFFGETAIPHADGALWWHLPRLGDMVSGAPDQIANKKLAWNILQRFSKERSS